MRDYPGRARHLGFNQVRWWRQRHQPATRFVVRRNIDGRIWAGPYRWNGTTFTKSDRLWYLYSNKDGAMEAVNGSGLLGVTVVQIA